MTERATPDAPRPEQADPAGSSGPAPGPAGPAPVSSGSAAGPRRRAFLLGGLGAGAVGAAAGVAGGYAYRATRAAPASEVALEQAEAGLLPPVPFEGQHQAGVLPVAQRQTAVISFNATAEGRSELTELFRTITARARFLTAGGTPPPAGIGGPPADSGVLGDSVVPDGLTVTLGVGATLFDDRYGLAGKRPGKLTQMAAFPNDDLDPAQCGGDLVLQLSAGHADVVMHALRDIARHTRGGMQASWRIDGFSSPARPSGTVPRNMLGFMDGIAGPDVTSQATMDQLVWIQPGTAGEPSWTAGGSYLVVRLIRMLVEFWDRVDLTEQENMIGRRRVTGFPLDSTAIHAIPNYTADPTGDVIPLTAHIRLANPRTAQASGSQILRRGYTYDRGIDSDGNLDIGLVFTCFQQDIKRQFETVQARLADEPLADYISPFGGGYFLALPGVVSSADYLGRALLA